MRYLIAYLALFMITGVFSCKKDSSSSTGIVGKWNVVTDSTSSTGVGAGNNATTKVYTGKWGDYFQFTAQGGFSAKESDVLSATGTYTDTGKMINIKYSDLVMNGATLENATGSYTIRSMSSGSLVLTNNVFTPGGAFFETIVLSK